MNNNNPPQKAEAVQAAGCALWLSVGILLPISILLLFMGPVGWAVLAALAGLMWWMLKN